MRQVIIVSLNSTAYNIDEDAYSALRKYLDSARRGLRDNPDVEEILADLERSIGEKCSQFLSPGKNVVTAENMTQILAEMGPVEEPAAEPETEHLGSPPPGAAAQSSRRLYKRRQGALLDGVCTGLAEYLKMDVVIVRVLFVVLAFASGFGILTYIILMLAMPADNTPRPANEPIPGTGARNGLIVVGAVLFVAFGGLYLFVSQTHPLMIGRFSGMPFAVGPLGMILMLLSPFLAIALIVGGTVLLVRFFRS